MSNTATLVPIGLKQATIEALRDMKQEASGKQLGLYSRYPSLNRSLLKYFRFGNIYTIAGGSGTGKSYFLNMLRTDFTDISPITLPMESLTSAAIERLKEEDFLITGKELVRYPINADFEVEILFLHFTYEMHPKKEQIRTVSTLTGYGFDYLHSAQWNNEKGDYVTLNDEDYGIVKTVLMEFANKREKMILMFATSGNLVQMRNTITEYAIMYPNKKLIVGIDHSLLSKHLSEKSDLELQDNTIKMAVDLRDEFDIMFLILAQLNSNIEEDKRRNTPALHYPVKRDLYMGGQLFQGSDFVVTMFNPSSIGISEYGPRLLPTVYEINGERNELIHLSIIKSRFSKTGQSWLLNNLGVGKLKAIKFDANKNFEETDSLIRITKRLNMPLLM